MSIPIEEYQPLTYWFRKGNSLKETDGARKYKDLSTLRTTFFIYKENYKVLRRAIKKYYSNPDILGEDSIKRWRLQRNLIKDFQNSLTSAWSFVERYKRKDYYLEDSLHCFFKELRHFTIHKQILPLISISQHKEDFTQNRYETFNREDFKLYLEHNITKHPNLNGYKKALNYLLSLEKEKSLNVILADYDSKISLYYSEEIKRLVNSNYEQLNEFANDIVEVHKYFPNHPITKSKLRHLCYLLSKVSQSHPRN